MVANNMGGGRNGKFKWLLGVAACLALVYLFYLYRGATLDLQDKEEELKKVEELQGRIGGQLKDLAQSHTSLQDELKTERVNHHRTRMEKSSLDKQCQEDINNMKETAEAVKFKLEQERDSYMSELEREKESKKNVQEQQDSLFARYEQDIGVCEADKKKAEDKLNSLRTTVAKANSDKDEAEMVHSQCQDKLVAAKNNVASKDYHLNKLQSELLGCQSNLQILESKKEDMEDELAEFKKQGRGVGGAGQMRVQSSLMDVIKDKLSRGERLSEEELRQFEEANEQQKIRKEREAGVPNSPGHWRRPGPPRPQSKFGSPARGGVEQNQDRGGMRQDKQQLPEVAEREEVKELELEDQEVVEKNKERGEEGDEGEDERAFKPEEKEGRGGKDGRAVEEEEDGRDYGVDGELKKKMEEDENVNLPIPDGDGGQQAMPHPDRVVAEFDGANRPPPKFENPDTAFDNQDEVNEQEELEKEQEGGENEEEDELGRRQLEEDMRMDHHDRKPEWNGNWGRGPDPDGMERGQNMDQAMRKMNEENDLRRRQVADQMEKNLQKRLYEQRVGGHRDNLR